MQSTPRHDTCHLPTLCAVSCRGRASAGRFSVHLLGLKGTQRSQPLSVIIPAYPLPHGVCVPCLFCRCQPPVLLYLPRSSCPTGYPDAPPWDVCAAPLVL